MRKNTIYLDYAATTPVDPEVLKEMMLYLNKEYGNPSSIYSLGQSALFAIDEAREKLANFLGCKATEVIFTGSATEANNLAIFGVVNFQREKLRDKKIHVVTSQIEHSSVLEPFKKLEREGIEVTFLPVNREGIISVSNLEKNIKENTILVSLMYANNEIGTIQPIKEIAEIIKKIKSKISTTNYKLPIFHTDAAQTANYLECNVNYLGVDLLTLSSHKIYGPKGVGALFVREGTEISPMVLGGGHEFGLRSGTENVAGICGFAKAVEKIKDSRLDSERIKKLRDKLIGGVLKNIPDSKLNGSLTQRIPNNANFTFNRIDGKSLVLTLDQEGILTSTGSACSEKSSEPSHVLLTLGLSEEEAKSSLRLTLGKYTTEKEIEKVLEILPKIVERLREIS